MKNQKDNLDNNLTDYSVSGAKAIIGLIPTVGPIISEAIASIIPNQRIDRIAKYLKELDEKIQAVSAEKVKELLQNEEFIDLLEEGIQQATRALNDERRHYIASIVANGIKDETIEFQESKFLLKILEELNDIEVIWLRSYLNNIEGDDEQFREKHKNVLAQVMAFINSSQEVRNKEALQKSYRAHLERLGLIKSKIRMDSAKQIPKFDRSTGLPETSYTEVTTLGRMLLKQINLFEDIK